MPKFIAEYTLKIPAIGTAANAVSFESGYKTVSFTREFDANNFADACSKLYNFLYKNFVEECKFDAIPSILRIQVKNS